MVIRRVVLVISLLLSVDAGADHYQDRFVWIFGWSLKNDEDVQKVLRIIETAAKHGYNGAVLSMGLDVLCKQDQDSFRRLESIQAACERDRLEVVPSLFSVGYGGGVLAHDRNLAEGLPVVDAPFVVKGDAAWFVPDSTVRIVNGGFEEYEGSRMKGYAFHDGPGVESFPDTRVVHSGKASLRFENFHTHPARNARVMQEITVTPRRCYRVSAWIKTRRLKPSANFRLLALADDHDLAPRSCNLPPTTDWRKVVMIFNSMDHTNVQMYAGVWDGQEGQFWIDDVMVEEIGPINVLQRPGTPVTMKSEDGAVTYKEGEDYAPLVDPHVTFWNVDREAPPLQMLAGSRLHDGQRLRVNWYHPMVIYESQVTVCMAEPALYEIFEHEAGLLWQHLQPQRVLLNMDEVRMGGSCQACRGRNMAELLGECLQKQVRILRRFHPEMEVFVWSDMLDPNHNAVPNYYLVEGDYTGVWDRVPKDLIIAVWGGTPREKSLRFFADHGFQTLIACYYDAPNLEEVKGWEQVARRTPGVRGFLYTTWEQRYKLLPAFGDLLWGK